MSDHEVSNSAERKGTDPEYRRWIENIEETAVTIASMLSDCHDVKLNYFDTNRRTYTTLHQLVSLESLLRAGPPIPEFQKAGAMIITYTPFTAAVRQAMADRIGDKAADEWYATCSDEDIVLIDRWRRQLDNWFPRAKPDDSDKLTNDPIDALDTLIGLCTWHGHLEDDDD
jgi:hypothetical protein